MCVRTSGVRTISRRGGQSGRPAISSGTMAEVYSDGGGGGGGGSGRSRGINKPTCSVVLHILILPYCKFVGLHDSSVTSHTPGSSLLVPESLVSDTFANVWPSYFVISLLARLGKHGPRFAWPWAVYQTSSNPKRTNCEPYTGRVGKDMSLMNNS